MFYPKSPFIQSIESHLFKRNQHQLNNILEWLCSTPKDTTYRVNLMKTTIEEFRNETEEFSAAKYNQNIETFTCNKLDEVVIIPSSQFTDNLKSFDSALKEVVVDCNCGAALLRGAHLYAPGVLAMQSGTKSDEIVNVFADWNGKCKKGTNTLYLSENKIFIGTGIVKQQRYQLFGDGITPKGIAVEMTSTISNVPPIGDLSSPKALLQNFPSIVCVRVLDPKPGEVILDMCSAPGNKTTHIAELMKDEGTIIALDKTESKICLVRQKITDNGLNSIHAFAFDSTKALRTVASDEQLFNTMDGPPFPPATFDKILLDAPCSALGNRPVLSSNLTPRMLESYPAVQKKLFAAAVELLKPGGVLVYSTCTITESENENIVKWALDKFTQIELVPADPIFGGVGLSETGLSDLQRSYVQRFGPQEFNRVKNVDSVGFFICKFVKL